MPTVGQVGRSASGSPATLAPIGLAMTRLSCHESARSSSRALGLRGIMTPCPWVPAPGRVIVPAARDCRPVTIRVAEADNRREVVPMAEVAEVSSSRGDVARRVTAAAVAVTTVAFGAAAGVLESNPSVEVEVPPSWLLSLAVVGLAGLIVAWARPRNLIGWLLLAAVLLQVVSLAGAAYAQAEYGSGDPGRGALFAAWLGDLDVVSVAGAPVAVLPSIYPSGRPRRRAQRVFVWSGVLGIAGMCAALGMGRDAPGDIVPGLRLPFGIPDPVGVLVLAGHRRRFSGVDPGWGHPRIGPDRARREPRASATLVVGGTDGCLRRRLLRLVARWRSHLRLDRRGGRRGRAPLRAA